MNSLLRRRASRASAWPLLALLGAAACSDAATPAGPAPDDPTLTETAMNDAIGEVDLQQESLFGEAERHRARERERGRERPGLDRPRLSVAFAGAAVDLAGRILQEEGADARQRDLFEEARRLLEAAREALSAGDTALAMRHAHAACWTALKAWVLPGGVSLEEADAVHALASDLLAAAAAAVEQDDEVGQRILSWASTFRLHGAEQLRAGNVRGVAALWKAAVLSHYLLT